jgi:large subunit ribosomal protein L9
MEVLLRKDIDKLGAAGQIVKVTPGYARNYLLPRKLATPATADNLNRLEAEKRRAEREAVKAHEALVELGKKLESTSCTVTAQAAESGTLFGSVAAAAIAEVLRAEGFPMVDEKAVQLAEPIKETGVYAVKVVLAPDIEATTRIWVVAD